VASLHTAKRHGNEKPDATLGWIQLGFDRRLSIGQAVESALVFQKVPSGPGNRLLLGLASTVAAPGHPGDGIVAHITCLGQGGAEVELLREKLSNVSDRTAQSWGDREVSLDPCSSQSTQLVLRTECQSGSCENAQVVWGDPHIKYEISSTIRPTGMVLLISVDTLRSDRMELYGGMAPTPNLIRLAEDSVVFNKTVAPSPWTIPSHASLFTSTDPFFHGTTAEKDIPSELVTIAEATSEAGWTSAGFVDTPWLGRFGFDRGFDHYDATAPPRPAPRWGVGITKQRLLEWLSDASADRVFVFWHIMDVHGPYGTQSPFAGRLRQLINPEETRYPPMSVFKTLGYHDYLDLDRFRCVEDTIAAYDEGIMRVDAAIGEMLEFLQDSGLYEKSTIVVTSDHGESLFDHEIWIGHGLFLKEDEIRIPLVIKLGDNRFAGLRVNELTRLIDVAPTILDEIGVPAPETFRGRSLLPTISGDRKEDSPLAFGTSSNTGAHYVRTEHIKYISRWSFPRDYVLKRHLHPKGNSPLVARIASGEQLFDVQNDPTESNNLIEDPEWRHIATSLRQQSIVATTTGMVDEAVVSVPSDSSLTDEEVERLRALGYLIPNSPE